MARYKTTGLTLKDLRLAATATGEPTRAGEPMSGVEAAKALKISQSHLSGIENGRDPASPFVLARMRTLYGVELTVVYAAYGETQRTVAPPRVRRKPKVR